MEYKFTDDDAALAYEVAITRMAVSKAKGYQHTGGLVCNKKKNFRIDLLGALGEIAFARILGEDPQCDLDACKRADHKDRWGAGWHIRATKWQRGRLIVRDHDAFSERYALVVIDVKNQSARIAGFTMGALVQAQGDYEAKSDREAPAWWVPQYRLKPFDHYLIKRGVIEDTD